MRLWASLCRRLMRWRDRRAARRSVGRWLDRADDRMIEDIGLTRQALRELLEEWEK